MSDPNNSQDQPQSVDVDLGMAVERMDSWVDGFVKLLPNIGVAIILMLLFYGIARIVAHLVQRTASSRSRDNLGDMLGGLIKWVIIVFGFLLAATTVVPSLKPGDLVAGLGVSSVAIGFAFKDILQNWLAGLLILLRQPFEVGDQIKVNDFEGTVERIETRATIIKTYDSQRAVIPNSEIYTNSVLVKTAHEKRRSQYDIGVGYADDLTQALDVIKKTISGVEGVESEPPVDALVWDLAASWITVRARWWTDSRRADVVQVRAEVLKAIKLALDDERIDMPYETQVHLFHDQTEESDGDRETQREGWPAPKEGSTKPRWRAEKELSTTNKDTQE